MRVMKITMMLITCLLVQVSASTFGQRINLNRQNSNIPTILQEIRKQSQYDFFYDANLFKEAKSIDIHVRDASIEQALAACFTNLPYRYVIKNKLVVVTEAPREERPSVVAKQQFTLVGKVISTSDRSPLAGVSVKVKGQQGGATTDGSGAFTITVSESKQTLVFSLLGHQTKEVAVHAADRNMVVQLVPTSTALDAVEVTVQARRKANTESAVLEERKKAAIVQDAISAELIERTGSITTTQALQRVTGVTVTDDKYVAVRGLGDRSVIGQLNGVRLASSDPDRSAIPLDLVPASLLDNITIYKTVTPDKPADAASGIVELKTKSVPDKMTFEVIAQTGLNSNIGLGGQYNSFWNSGMGVLGTKINDKNLTTDFTNLATEYPGGLGSIQRMIANSNYSPAAYQEVKRINGIMQGFDPVMTSTYRKAPLNQLYSVTFGNSYNVFDGKHKIGVILGGNYYRRTTDINAGELTQYSIYQGVVTGNPDVYSFRNIPNYITPNSLYMGKYQTYKENTGTETLNYGTLAGLTYRFSPQHEVSMQYLGSWGGESIGTNLSGKYEYTGLPGGVKSTTYSLKQTFRNLNTFNLQGEHKFFKHELSPRLSYNAASSRSRQNDPDFRFASLVDYMPRGGGWYYRPTVGADNGGDARVYSEHLYALTSGYVNGFGVYGIMQAEPNGRRWRNLDEKNYNYKADLSIPFRILGEKQEFKTGVNYLFRDRAFTENQLFLPGSNFTSNKAVPLYDVAGNLDRLVSNEIIGVHLPAAGQGEGMMPVGGFLYNSQKSPNNYTGYYETNALYGMVDLKLAKRFRMAGGVRFEMTNIGSSVDTVGVFLDPSLTAVSPDGSRIPLNPINPNSVYKTGYKPFYSVNATFTLNDNMNFRGAFNTTLARPELREITNVFEFDAFQMGLVVGNPDLKNQYTQNADFRWEWFPAKGEVIAVSAFGKRIENQLVKVFNLKTQGLAATYPEFPTIQFQNDPNIGRVWGLEFEVVKNLGTLIAPLQHFFLGSNLLLAQSEIKKTEERYEANRSLDRHAPKNSPLFEQAPYSINGWLNYDNDKSGTDLTLTFNMVGERLVQINLTGEPDLYTQPVPYLDFVFSQRINKRIIFKGYAKNIINPANKTVYANPQTGGKWYGNEYINRSFKRGTEIMMGFTYNLF
ncbi:TonB-dependent receptor [Sphingobacterium psychroaquaticum]|nr:TonB-dependent receptor [Sphingobacterium psychroaquaticum]